MPLQTGIAKCLPIDKNLINPAFQCPQQKPIQP